VRVDQASLRAVVEETANAVRGAGAIEDDALFRQLWAEERDRQFREEVPELREVDLDQRVVRVLARMRGFPEPPPEAHWDDAAAWRLVGPAEVAFAVEAYSVRFVEVMAPLPDAESTLEGLHRDGFRLGIVSNWPLARTIDRYVEARSWDRWLGPIVVSQRVGVIKPHPAIFEAAAEALGAKPGAILHVGDDWAADVVGALAAGWHVAYLRGHQGDTPLPTSDPDHLAEPDLVIDRLSQLAGRIQLGAPVVPP
jgi:HAD superfamily hydrolase (TIGR01509 family)